MKKELKVPERKWITATEYAIRNNVSRARVYQYVSGFKNRKPTFRYGTHYKYGKGGLLINKDAKPKKTGRPKKEVDNEL